LRSRAATVSKPGDVPAVRSEGVSTDRSLLDHRGGSLLDHRGGSMLDHRGGSLVDHP